MITWMRERLNKEEGFTLVELMVVVLIIAILIAIAIPTFLGARERAQDRAAQSNLRNALTAEKVYYTDEETYTDSAAGELDTIEPSLVFQSASTAVAASTIGDVHVLTTDPQVVCVTTLSASGKIFGLADIANDVGAGTYYATDPVAANCPANGAAVPGAPWDAAGF